MRHQLDDAPVRVVESWVYGDVRTRWGRSKMTWIKGVDMKELGLREHIAFDGR